MRRLQYLAFVVVTKTALAQFTPAMIQNDSYWNDGKAEFSIYGAELMRDGVPRTCEVLHIAMREKSDSPSLRFNQIINVPTGLFVLQQMHSSYWAVKDGGLIKFSLTSGDSSENVFKEAVRSGAEMSYEYRGSTAAKETIAVPPNGYFYDELPWLVRTIDFTKPNEFEIQLAGSAINSKKDNFVFQPAKVSFAHNERFVDVKVQHAAGEDRFTLDRGFPHLLREWKAWDGNHLKLKRNLKVDYWNYSKPGDRERALNNPMLRLPD